MTGYSDVICCESEADRLLLQFWLLDFGRSNFPDVDKWGDVHFCVLVFSIEDSPSMKKNAAAFLLSDMT
jgi:hypothetical protein